MVNHIPARGAGKVRNDSGTGTILSFRVCHLTTTTTYDYDTKCGSSARLAKGAKSDRPANPT